MSGTELAHVRRNESEPDTVHERGLQLAGLESDVYKTDVGAPAQVAPEYTLLISHD